MSANQKIAYGRGPSNINLSIFVCSFDVCGLHNQSPLLTQKHITYSRWYASDWLWSVFDGFIIAELRRRSRRKMAAVQAKRLTKTCSPAWFIASFDIRRSRYGQLTPVKTKYPLTSLTWPCRGSWLELIDLTCFFSKLTADQVLVVLVVLVFHVRLT